MAHDSTTKTPNPITEQEVTCPMCGTVSTQQRLKQRLFSEQDLEVDLRPRRYLWTIRGVVVPHPPLYYMWRCRSCQYTASTVSFEEPMKSASLTVQNYKTKIQAARKSNPSIDTVIDDLSSSIEGGEIDHFSAIRMHLLAIFHLQIIDEIVQKDCLELAKYSLRLGWLFREFDENPNLQQQFGALLKDLYKKLELQWPEVPLTENAAMHNALHYYRTALEKSTAVDQIQVEIELQLIIARIAMRLGNIPVARQYIEISKARVKKEEEVLNKNKELPDRDKRVAEVRKLNLAIEKAQDILSDFRGKWEDEQIEKANAIVSSHKQKTPEQLKALLAENGFDTKIIGIVVKAPPAKKGLFGGLFG